MGVLHSTTPGLTSLSSPLSPLHSPPLPFPALTSSPHPRQLGHSGSSPGHTGIAPRTSCWGGQAQSRSSSRELEPRGPDTPVGRDLPGVLWWSRCRQALQLASPTEGVTDQRVGWTLSVSVATWAVCRRETCLAGVWMSRLGSPSPRQRPASHGLPVPLLPGRIFFCCAQLDC